MATLKGIDAHGEASELPIQRGLYLGVSVFKDGVGIAEGLELQRITGGIEQKERALFAWLVGEPDLGLHDEGVGCAAHSLDQAVPSLPGQHGAEMVERHHICADPGRGLRLGIIVDVGRELMPKEIEINPIFSLASDLAADDLAVEVSGGFLVLDSKGHVKWYHWIGPKRLTVVATIVPMDRQWVLDQLNQPPLHAIQLPLHFAGSA